MFDTWTKLYLKFSADSKSLNSELAKYTLNHAEDLWKALEKRDKSMEGHEKKLGTAAIAAYEAGVTSKKLPEFMKDKGFATAKALLDADRKQLVIELNLLEDYCDKCKAAAAKAYTLAQKMAKDLMADKTKDKHPEREKVKKLRETLMAKFEDLTKAEKMRFKPPNYMNVFDTQYDKLIDHLIAEALKKGKDPEDQLEVPQPLTDKKLGMMVKESARLSGQVLINVTKNYELKDTKPKDAAPFLKKAEGQVDKMKKIEGAAEALKRKFKDVIADMKERVEILKQFKMISEDFEKAEKLLSDGPPKAKVKPKDDKVG